MRSEINRRTLCAGLSAASLLTLRRSLPAAALRNGKKPNLIDEGRETVPSMLQKAGLLHRRCR